MTNDILEITESVGKYEMTTFLNENTATGEFKGSVGIFTKKGGFVEEPTDDMTDRKVFEAKLDALRKTYGG